MHDINEQTYIPGTCTACTVCTAHPESLYFLVYKRRHPQPLGCISAYVRKIISIIFLPTCTTHFSPFFSPFCIFFFSLPQPSCFTFHFTTTHDSIVSGLHNHSMWKCNIIHALILLNGREIDKQYLHCLVPMLF